MLIFTVYWSYQWHGHSLNHTLTPVQLMRPGIGWNASCAADDFAKTSRHAFLFSRRLWVIDCSCTLPHNPSYAIPWLNTSPFMHIYRAIFLPLSLRWTPHLPCPIPLPVTVSWRPPSSMTALTLCYPLLDFQSTHQWNPKIEKCSLPPSFSWFTIYRFVLLKVLQIICIIKSW